MKKVQTYKEHKEYIEKCEKAGSKDWLMYDAYIVLSSKYDGYWMNKTEIYFGKGKGLHKSVENRWKEVYREEIKNRLIKLNQVIYQ